MKTIDQIRAENARKLRDSVGGNAAFATHIDREPTQVSRLIGINPTKKIGDIMARHIEKCFGLPIAWLDQEHGDNKTNPPEIKSPSKEFKIRQVPLLTWVQAGAWTECESIDIDEDFIKKYPCPVPCSERTFALSVVGESMYPEYMPGEIIFVDPEVPALTGDDVVAMLVDTGQTTFKRLIDDGFSKMLKAVNPNWPNQYVPINGNCNLMGTVIFSGRARKK
ncbi:LexA family transcriptional repressor [Providencia rettgeri]|uniref:LexA family protein n=1 Tax=Providencia rettgeri TaxID=587 RepID=UPI000D00EB6C|nr:S24 family peptidase [Providencia rettgeri]AVL76174.1 LexA family transcriptional repressor [Providencia rettgeri]EJD6672455.1 LexA family transcriptional repressor [Providencia rettgeri]